MNFIASSSRCSYHQGKIKYGTICLFCPGVMILCFYFAWEQTLKYDKTVKKFIWSFIFLLNFSIQGNLDPIRNFFHNFILICFINYRFLQTFVIKNVQHKSRNNTRRKYNLFVKKIKKCSKDWQHPLEKVFDLIGIILIN